MKLQKVYYVVLYAHKVNIQSLKGGKTKNEKKEMKKPNFTVYCDIYETHPPPPPSVI